ncbi:antitoxin VapB family protein [Halorussus salilacus]|uniref:antitoxin VapB family protein n=1 Tax=Halorussus salilacus TaxID=2953750 RepID=UPI00209FC011|nr:antitoxin VapB family protein [Halorussus salilacus]USZ67179.1 antitoxin VapB family protein [Halorussus salilacus]
MGTKNISIRDDVYRKLKDSKQEDESFSDAIDRLMASREGDHPLYDLVGMLDDEDAERLRDRTERFRERVEEDMRRHE